MCILFQHLYRCKCVVPPGDVAYQWCSHNPLHHRITDREWCPEKYRVERIMLNECDRCVQRGNEQKSEFQDESESIKSESGKPER